MVDVLPLNALRYDPAVAGDMSTLLAPPYDVIGPDAQAALETRSAFNAVHLILPRATDDRYARAATTLAEWRARGVLQPEAPAMWLYEEGFDDRGTPRTRRAILAGVRVRPYEDRAVLPHERTHAGPKEDRYRLKMATKTHLSPFFALYDDTAGVVAEQVARAEEPVFDVKTPDGLRHVLRRLRNDAAAAITRAMQPGHLVIADGHHRYETMLRLARELGTPEAGIGFACLVALQDQGLVVWPTHRTLRVGQSSSPAARPAAGAGAAAGANGTWNTDSFLNGARKEFEVEVRARADAAEIEKIVAVKTAKSPTFALAAGDRDSIAYVSVRPGINIGDLPPALAKNEAAVLEQALRAYGPAGATVAYTHDAAEALGRIASSESVAAFILPAARVSDVMAVAEAGLSMPQKSTFFFPKVPTGLLFHPFA